MNFEICIRVISQSRGEILVCFKSEKVFFLGWLNILILLNFLAKLTKKISSKCERIRKKFNEINCNNFDF